MFAKKCEWKGWEWKEKGPIVVSVEWLLWWGLLSPWWWQSASAAVVERWKSCQECVVLFVCVCEWVGNRRVEKWSSKWTNDKCDGQKWSTFTSCRAEVAAQSDDEGNGYVYVHVCFSFISACVVVYSPISFGDVSHSGRALLTLLYIFVCVVQSSVCHLFNVKGWPTFSCAFALCSGSAGVHTNTVYDWQTWTFHKHCYLECSAV